MRFERGRKVTRPLIRRVVVRALTFKKEYVDMILRGLKTTTIRLGIIIPKSNKLLIYSQGRAVGEIFVESVRYSKVRDLTDRDAQLDGFKNKNELIKKLEEHYPGISGNDWVTIIKFRLLKKFKKRKVKGYDEGEIAKLALAYNIVKDREKYRIIAAIATTGSIDGAYEVLEHRYSKKEIKEVLVGVIDLMKRNNLLILDKGKK